MGTNEVRGVHYHSDSEVIGSERMENHSGPLSGPLSGSLNKQSGTKKNAKFNIVEPGSPTKPGIISSDEEPYVEVCLDFGDDSIAVHNVILTDHSFSQSPERVKTRLNDHQYHGELMGKGLEKSRSSPSSSAGSRSARIKQVSQELKRLTSSSRVRPLKGLKFFSKTDGKAVWPEIEKRFFKLTDSTNGLLPRSLFGECIGMNKESEEFAGQLFDMLARKCNIKGDYINKDQLKEFWDQISDQSFDSKLQTFFDMVDKDADGRITIDDIREIISYSASANKLSNIQKQADEYAALIMEELDPENLGYIMIDDLKMLLLQGPEEVAAALRREPVSLIQMLSPKLKPRRKRPLRTWSTSTKYFLQDNWKRVWTRIHLANPLRFSIKPASISKVAVCRDVMVLHVSKPRGFRYYSGQHMFVKCVDMSPSEWHPLYITSAPGDGYLSVPIRNVGNYWARKLRMVFAQACRPPHPGQEADEMRLPRLLIKGPFGAPVPEYKKYEVVLLVGRGIEATPMISILKDIVNNVDGMKKEEVHNVLANAESRPRRHHTFKTKKAYFYRVTREGSSDWFKGLMNEVEESDRHRAIEFHDHCISVNVYEEHSAFVSMLRALSQAKNGLDIVSGSRVKSHFAKPNWREIYTRIARRHTNERVGVFYCGPPPLTEELRQLSLEFSYKSPTKFDFYKKKFL